MSQHYLITYDMQASSTVTMTTLHRHIEDKLEELDNSSLSMHSISGLCIVNTDLKLAFVAVRTMRPLPMDRMPTDFFNYNDYPSAVLTLSDFRTPLWKMRMEDIILDSEENVGYPDFLYKMVLGEPTVLTSVLAESGYWDVKQHIAHVRRHHT